MPTKLKTNGPSFNAKQDSRQQLEQVSPKDQSPEDKKEDTKRALSLLYVGGFLGIIVLALIQSWARGFGVAEMKDLLLGISGIMTGALGFIIGYYYKSEK